MKPHILIVGGGGRESAFARVLGHNATVSAVLPHPNPSIVRTTQQSGGRYYLGDPCSREFVLKCAQELGVDYVFVNSDNPLQAGIVDELLAADIKAIGPTRAGARIEWDKIYTTRLMEQLFPEYMPYSHVVDCEEACARALADFEQRALEVVVKPQGLTGGKGVKVMGEHLQDYDAALRYARELLASEGAQVLLSEKLVGYEFTMMAITDGCDMVFAPATYDYPYRYEGDKGLGTGGMGCLTDTCHRLPFMREEEYLDCQSIMRGVIEHFNQQDIHFNGVLNGGFFVTKAGVRFMEFNSRFGDPEVMNVLAVLETSFTELLECIYHRRLNTHAQHFSTSASVVKYLVAPEYPLKPDTPTALEFDMPIDQIEAQGVNVDCASMVMLDSPNRYRALPGSRVVAFSCVADSVVEASTKLNRVIEHYMSGSGLEYRRDIGSEGAMALLQAGLDNR